MESADDLQADIDLLRRTGMGDRAGFAQLHHRYIGLVYSTAFRILNSRTDAEDVAQDVMFMIWEKSPLFNAAKGKPATWILTMARNRAIDRFRSLQRRFRLQDEVEKETLLEGSIHDRKPADDMDATEQGAIVCAAVNKLGTEQREVIELTYFGGLTQQEIASRLGEPLGTVKARIRRGMLRLKKMLAAPGRSPR